MSDLVEFLRARLDEDEAAAKAASPGQWTATGTRIEWGADTVARMAVPSGMYRTRMADAAHIARWDPARVLAEVAAKRLVLADHEYTTQVLNAYGPSAANPQPMGCERCHDWDGVTMGLGWCTTIWALAQPYASHPDFDPAWLTPPAKETP